MEVHNNNKTTQTQKAKCRGICVHDLWTLAEASRPEGKETGQLLRAGKPGLSWEAWNSASWEERESTAPVRDEAGEQLGSTLLKLRPDPKGCEELLRNS